MSLLQLTPAFQRWCQSVSPEVCNLPSYSAYVSRVDHLLCYLDIVWPDFDKRDGLILRRSNIPEDWPAFQAQAQQAAWSPQQIEYVINHVHVMDLFLNDPDRDQIPTAVYTVVADRIATTWQCRLQQLYPSTRFTIGVEDRDVSPEVYAVQA